MEQRGEDKKQSSHKNPYIELEEVSFDFILAIGLQQQERTMTMLATIESESDDDDDDDDDGDADFSESQEFEADPWFLEGEGSNYDNAEMEMEMEEEEEEEEDEEEEEEEDEIDPDELSYEELIELGEFIGKEKRGLSENEISLCLYPYTYCCQSTIENKTGSVDRCVICQVEYEQGEEALVALQCEHPYHTDCISKWLQINKVCPICGNEVSTPNRANN